MFDLSVVEAGQSSKKRPSSQSAFRVSRCWLVRMV